jgi:hypothetical protein
MAEQVEARGPGLKAMRTLEKQSELHHLRIAAHESARPGKPAWVVEHHTTEQGDGEPEAYTFHDGNEMLGHIAHHAFVPSPQGEGEPEEER